MIMHLTLENVTFHRSGTAILKGIDLQLKEGHHYCLIGPNGAGKTTLLSILCGLDWPTTGRALVHTEDGIEHPAHVRHIFGHFFPRYAAHIEAYHPDITAIELISTGFRQAIACYQEVSAEEWQTARTFFHKYVHSTEENRSFSTMSTGERFRLLLLRSLVTYPAVLILDEPFDGLDLTARIAFERLIAEVLKEHTRLSISVLHRIEEVPEYITDVILIKEGRILTSGAKHSVLTSQNLSRLYNLKLICREYNGRYTVLHEG
jgi:iron complex transport system ATP-binding protein